MDETQHPLPITEIERLLVAALCASELDQQKHAEILDCLAAHKFADPDYETIFLALANLPRAASEHIRETLGARLTRLGFPDIDVERILDLAPPSTEKITILLQQLGC
jgi:hypothetical protein